MDWLDSPQELWTADYNSDHLTEVGLIDVSVGDE